MLDSHIETFLTVAEQGSFSKAAEVLHVSRTALIQQVNLLEQRLEFSLFARSNKGVELTASGEKYYNECRKALRQFEKVINECRATQSSSVLKIGILPNFPSVYLPTVLKAYKRKFPERQIEFTEYSNTDFFKEFKKRKFDIAVEYMAPFYYGVHDYKILTLGVSKHCLAVPENHPMADKDKIVLDDLKEYSIMMYRRGISTVDDILRDHLEDKIPDIQIIDMNQYTSALSTECQLYNSMLVFYDGYETNFPSLIKKDLDAGKDIPIKLGLGYHDDAPFYVTDFIDLAKYFYL